MPKEKFTGRAKGMAFVTMSTEELKYVIQKVLRLFRNVELQELPPIIYQLSLLCAKVSFFSIRPFLNLRI